MCQTESQSSTWQMDDRHLANFWAHHRAALRWFEVHRECRGYAINYSPKRSLRPSFLARGKTQMRPRRVVPARENLMPSKGKHSLGMAQNSSTDSLPDVEEELVSQKNTDNEIDMSTEMAAFFRQTIEHRKQRDAKEAEKKKEKTGLETEEDDYVMADKIGVYGPERRSLVLPDGPSERQRKLNEMRKLYGSGAEKIMAMETHLNLRFEQCYSQPGAQLWPNIPLKL